MDPLLIEVPEHIETERLLLRRARPGDGAAVCAAVRASLDELRPWMPWAQAEPSVDESETHVRRMHANFSLRQDLAYFMFDRAADSSEAGFIGGIGLHRIDWTVRRFEVGYWRRFGRAGRGFVSEAVRALSRMSFDDLAAQRVEIRMDERNAASARVAERAGFTFEGLLRRDTRTVVGAPRDTRVYSRVRGIEEP